MANLTGAWRSFWHTMTSNDRHASPDQPYRTGAHTPLSQSRHAPLTSVTTAADSSVDLNTSYSNDDAQGFMPASNGAMSPTSPYAPGARSTMQRQSSSGTIDTMANGEIQMQSFSEGLPPPPPVSHSWRRIEGWCEANYEEVGENLCEGCTQNDVNELEHELDCTLPMEVRESLMIHDGQERGGRPTGVIFGCMLLDCEEIVQEWRQWARINDEYLRSAGAYVPPQAPVKAFAGASSSAPPPAQQPGPGANWRQELINKQDSQPPNAVQKAYVHPAWIPMARDWGGNNICVDLAPGPAGKWGQVILMGRDYDCKYVISRSWAAFLATVADDMSTDKWYIEEDTAELKLREFKNQNVEPSYMDILRWRCDQKYGRKVTKQAPRPKSIRTSKVPNEYGSLNGFSPYASPTTATRNSDERGRSPQRFNGKAPATSSPRGHVSSPLARVTEEAATPIPALQTENLKPDDKAENLMSLDSPLPKTSVEDAIDAEANKIKLLDDEKHAEGGAADGEMKTVEI
ncbi:hypothetical protein AAFC00_003455 [Neodothiora populina]|uniref:Knr4/Smi1-like domain-containing protein n=1 Tax=Neodothiora populina TaxID=2781224 RepID=A0ABR3PFA9_9PEZI